MMVEAVKKGFPTPRPFTVSAAADNHDDDDDDDCVQRQRQR